MKIFGHVVSGETFLSTSSKLLIFINLLILPSEICLSKLFGISCCDSQQLHAFVVIIVVLMNFFNFLLYSLFYICRFLQNFLVIQFIFCLPVFFYAPSTRRYSIVLVAYPFFLSSPGGRFSLIITSNRWSIIIRDGRLLLAGS